MDGTANTLHEANFPDVLRFPSADDVLNHSDASTLLFTAAKTAQLCGVSERTWRTWDSAGYIPAAVEIGRSKFWRPEEIKAWIEAGCPRRAKWKILR